MQANRHLKRHHSRIASSDSEADDGKSSDEETVNPGTNPVSRQQEVSLVNNNTEENAQHTNIIRHWASSDSEVEDNSNSNDDEEEQAEDNENNSHTQ